MVITTCPTHFTRTRQNNNYSRSHSTTVYIILSFRLGPLHKLRPTEILLILTDFPQYTITSLQITIFLRQQAQYKKRGVHAAISHAKHALKKSCKKARTISSSSTHITWSVIFPSNLYFFARGDYIRNTDETHRHTDRQTERNRPGDEAFVTHKIKVPLNPERQTLATWLYTFSHRTSSVLLFFCVSFDHAKRVCYSS